jgi:hypothetical protein
LVLASACTAAVFTEPRVRPGRPRVLLASAHMRYLLAGIATEGAGDFSAAPSREFCGNRARRALRPTATRYSGSPEQRLGAHRDNGGGRGRGVSRERVGDERQRASRRVSLGSMAPSRCDRCCGAVAARPVGFSLPMPAGGSGDMATASTPRPTPRSGSGPVDPQRRHPTRRWSFRTPRGRRVINSMRSLGGFAPRTRWALWSIATATRRTGLFLLAGPDCHRSGDVHAWRPARTTPRQRTQRWAEGQARGPAPLRGPRSPPRPHRSHTAGSRGHPGGPARRRRRRLVHARRSRTRMVHGTDQSQSSRARPTSRQGARVSSPRPLGPAAIRGP